MPDDNRQLIGGNSLFIKEAAFKFVIIYEALNVREKFNKQFR